MSEPSGGRGVRLAQLLGVFQEARRFRHRRVGSEHVLMATFADPVVRWALANVGCDLRDVQVRVEQHGEGRASTDAVAGLTPRAAELLTRAVEGVPDLDLDRSPSPRLFSTLLGLVMITLLRDEQDTAARRILDECGLRAHTQRLTASIRQDSGSSALPRPH